MIFSMKKCMVIVLIFLFAAANVFAQIQVSGELRAGVELAYSDVGNDASVRAGRISALWAGVQADGGSDRNAGDVGGRIKIGSASNWPDAVSAFAWWWPHSVLRLQFGRNPDGDFGLGLGGWGVLENTQDTIAMGRWKNILLRSGFDAAHNIGFYEGFSGLGALISLFPADRLRVNIVVPFGIGDHGSRDVPAQDFYQRLHYQINYAMANAGTISFTYRGGTGAAMPVDGVNTIHTAWGANWGDPHRLWLSFRNTNILLSGLDFDMGLGYMIAHNGFQPPLQIGLNARYRSGAFNIRFRSGLQVMGSIENNAGQTQHTPLTLGFGLLPNYSFGSFRVFFNTGINVEMEQTGAAQNYIAWYVNPYIRVPVSGFTFSAGFILWNGRQNVGGGTPPANPREPRINWSIPVAVNYAF